MEQIDNIEYDALLIDRWRFEIPVNYDDMQNKKIGVFDYQTERNYVFSFSEKHINTLTLDAFFKMLKKKGDV
tara:strand:- start:1312 stop:1527 length:216 start_codon:yes stop_codon:yes gene_type:complete